MWQESGDPRDRIIAELRDTIERFDGDADVAPLLQTLDNFMDGFVSPDEAWQAIRNWNVAYDAAADPSSCEDPSCQGL